MVKLVLNLYIIIYIIFKYICAINFNKEEISDMNKSKRKKVLMIILVVVLAGLGLYTYNTYLGPKSVAGEKAVSIQVVIEEQDIGETYNYDTDYGFLYDLLKVNQEELGISFKEYDFGTMLVGIMGYKADESNNEYFHISINGEDALEGPQGIVLNDGDVYKIKLATW